MTCRGAHCQGTVRVPADMASHVCPRDHRECCLTCPKPLANLIPASRKSWAVLYSRTGFGFPCPSLGTCFPLPPIQSADQSISLPRCPGLGWGGAAVSFGMEPSGTRADSGPEWVGLGRSPPFRRWYPSLPGSSVAMAEEARKTIWGSLTPEGGERRTCSPMPTARPIQNTTLVAAHGSQEGCPAGPAPSENSPHCVPGPCGHQTHPDPVGPHTWSSWALAMGGHTSGGLQPSDAYVGLSNGFVCCLGEAWMLWVSSNPDSVERHDMVAGTGEETLD